MKDHKKSKIKTAEKVAGVVIILLLGFLIGARIYLPYWLTDYVNRQIAALDGYSGSVEDIDVHLWRGAYTIHGLNIYKDGSGMETPFVAAQTIDLSVEWRALFHGSVVAEIDVKTIDLNFAKSQTGEGAGWGKFVDALSPLDINRFEVHGGKVAYMDYTPSPDINLYIAGIEAKITNLRDVEDKGTALPSDIRVSGMSVGKGNFNMTGQMNILKDTPDFDLDIKLEDANLTAFNDYTRTAAAFDFESGTIGIYSELAAADGNLTGYVKPQAYNVSLVDIENQDTNPFNAVWESVVSVFMEVFENQPQDQFAMRIPIEGNINNPDRNMWSAFLSIFKNAFGGAFPKDTEGNVNFRDALRESL